MNEKALRAGCASRGVEVSCKQHRSSAKESQATLCSIKQFLLMHLFQKNGKLLSNEPAGNKEVTGRTYSNMIDLERGRR